MGTNEDGKSSRSEKPSSPAKLTKLTNPTNDHVHPDWAAIQAHYGPRVAIPPYYHYIWGAQQPIVAPYGTPYAAVYTHGNVYAHPAVPFIAATPLSMETPSKSTENGGKGLMKKLRSFDGLEMSLGNGGTEIIDSEAEDTMSMSVETGGSSNGNLAVSKCIQSNRTRRKRSREGTPATGAYEKTDTPADPSSDEKVKQENVCVGLSKQLNGPVTSPAIAKDVEPTSLNPPSESWSKEKELKRERRKQSNRESARRSRLRKQAEAEELAQKVEFLSAENMSIKSELSQLAEKSKKLKLENASLLGRLSKTKQEGSKELLLNIIAEKRGEVVSTENFLPSTIDSDPVNTNSKEDCEIWPKISNPGPKLHQLLDSSLRTDAVGAS